MNQLTLLLYCAFVLLCFSCNAVPEPDTGGLICIRPVNKAQPRRFMSGDVKLTKDTLTVPPMLIFTPPVVAEDDEVEIEEIAENNTTVGMTEVSG